jgi:DNA-binding NarL/FixJ family response regulator
MLSPMSGRIVSPTFVGRADALTAADQALRRSAAGRASHLLVAGEAGIGKTRFAEAVSTRSLAAGFRVLRGGCVALGSGELPYAPIGEALRGLARDLEPKALAAVVADRGPVLARITPALDPEGEGSRDPGLPGAGFPVRGLSDAARARLYEALLGLLGRLSTESPVLLVVDDLHWADSASLDTLAFLLRSLRHERVELLLTLRSDELHRRHPLRSWLSEIERMDNVERLDLGPLEPAETAELIAAIRGDAPGHAFAAQIQGRSDGNPFFIEELLAGDGVGRGRTGLSAGLRDILLAQVEGVRDDAKTVLDAAAVAGREVDVDLVAEVAALAPKQFDAGLDACLERHLLVVNRGHATDRLAFRHALIQEVVEDGLLPAERIRLHRAIAEALAGRFSSSASSEPGTWAELAGHWDAAHDERRALDAALHAAEDARRAYAFEAALAQYRRALVAWELTPDPAEIAGFDHIELLTRAAEAAALSSSPAQISLLREAVAEADRGEDDMRRSLLHGRLGVALWVMGEPIEATAIYRQAVSLMPPGPASEERSWMLAGLGRILMLDGQSRESAQVLETAIAMAREVGDRRTEGNALNTLAGDLADLGRGELATALWERSFELAVEIDDPEELGRAYSNGIEMLAICGHNERALDLVPEGVERTSATGMWRAWGSSIDLHAAVIAYGLGRWSDAGSYVEAGQLQDLDPQSEAYTLVRTVPLLVGRGDWDTAATMLARIGELLGRFETEFQYTGPYTCARAELALWQGHPRDALAAIEEGLERLERTDDTRFTMRLIRLGTRAAADLAEVARDRRDATRTEALQVAAGLRARCQPAVAAIAEMDGGLALELAAEEATVAAEDRRLHGDRDPVAWREAAERWAARRRPYHCAYVRYREAEASLGHGDRAGATAALREADGIATALGARPLLGAIEALGRRARITLASRGTMSGGAVHQVDEAAATAAELGLTAREREVLDLLARGLTNRQIADTLYISVYTAGIHVSRILGKLEVTSRTEAASKAYRLGLVSR